MFDSCIISYVVMISLFQVDENMKKAQRRDAVLNEKFYFRKDILSRTSFPLRIYSGIKPIKY